MNASLSMHSMWRALCLLLKILMRLKSIPSTCSSTPHLSLIGFLLLLKLLAELAVRSHSIAVLNEDVWDQSHGKAEKAEQAAGPSYTKLRIHRSCCKRQYNSKDRTGAARGSHGTGSVDFVGIDYVIELAHEDEEEANTKG
jgi:hypothetical protein